MQCITIHLIYTWDKMAQLIAQLIIDMYHASSNPSWVVWSVLGFTFIPFCNLRRLNSTYISQQCTQMWHRTAITQLPTDISLDPGRAGSVNALMVDIKQCNLVQSGEVPGRHKVIYTHVPAGRNTNDIHCYHLVHKMPLCLTFGPTRSH